MRVILIIGAFGSGTSALTGALSRLCVQAFGPHFHSSDERTINTFEMLAFRDLLHRYCDEVTMTMRGADPQMMEADFRRFHDQLESGVYGAWPKDGALVGLLKAPLAAFFLPVLTSVFDLHIVLVQRRFDEIEACRERRGWPARYGAAGAQQIYNQAFSDLGRLGQSYLTISYKDLTHQPARTLRVVVDFCQIEVGPPELARACDFIRPG